MARFWIGTSGWQYRHWKGRFYPEKVPQREWLHYYSQRFPTVEINNSFYMQPSDTSWDSWRVAAPKEFRYAVKAHQYITHWKRLRDCEESLERGIKAARRLGGHLGPMLFQLPPQFKRTDETADRLDSFLGLLPGSLDSVFEFRDKSWFVEETFEVLRRRNVAFCSFDSTKLDSPLVATADFAYVRFHGTGARDQGNYPDSMLKEWASRLKKVASDVDDAYVYFNNDARANAVANAMTLSEMLGVSLAEPALAR